MKSRGKYYPKNWYFKEEDIGMFSICVSGNKNVQFWPEVQDKFAAENSVFLTRQWNNFQTCLWKQNWELLMKSQEDL